MSEPVLPPYVHKLLLEIVRDALATATDIETDRPIKSTTRLPADLTGSVPLVYLRAATSSTVDPRGLFRASVTVDVYAHGDNQAQAVSAAVWRLLLDAWRKQSVYPAGHLSSWENPVAPFDTSSAGVPDDVVRYTAEYDLGLRPPA